MLRAVVNYPGGNTQQNSRCTVNYRPSQKLYSLDKPHIWDIAGDVMTKSLVIYSSGALHMDEQRQDDKLEPIYNSSVPMQDVALKTSQEQ